MSNTNKIKVAFVCTGNTCRSPMAQFILKQKLKQNNFDNVEVSSFGINVIEDKMNEKAVEALKELNVKRTKFTPKQLCKPEKFDALITMTKDQKHFVKSLRSNVYSISDLSAVGDIPDPYGRDLSNYVIVANLLNDACNDIINLLRGLENENSYR